MKLSDLQSSDGIPVYAVIRSNESSGSWLDLHSVSHTIEGAADSADAHPGSREWKSANPARAIVPLRLTLAPDGQRIPIPNTPSRRAR